jgi:flavin reductase (DIM6/NTAB) family NADH-FMN oxidoreductase RutF
VLDAAIAYHDCALHELVEAGDHVVAIGRVLDGAILREGSEPLTNRILGWSYAG